MKSKKIRFRCIINILSILLLTGCCFVLGCTPSDEPSKARVEALLRTYNKPWLDIGSSFKIVSIENEFKTKTPSGEIIVVYRVHYSLAASATTARVQLIKRDGKWFDGWVQEGR